MQITQTPRFYNTYLFLLLVEVVDNHTNKEVESEERTEDDEDDKVEVHVEVHFVLRLVLQLKHTPQLNISITVLYCIFTVFPSSQGLTYRNEHLHMNPCYYEYIYQVKPLLFRSEHCKSHSFFMCVCFFLKPNRKSYISRVHSCVHDVHPTFKRCLGAGERERVSR